MNAVRFQIGLMKRNGKGIVLLGVSYDDSNGDRFGGFVSFVDRIKETTAEMVVLARKMNVEITIITGDALLVAEAVGREAGLVTGSNEVMDATAFLMLPKLEQRKRMGIIRVFARTTPDQKLELIQLLKEQYTVGFLGEGINDAPALKATNVSMVVQSASDVARETADIVLLKNDLRVIVAGIRLGRETFANKLKYIRATLISNFGNFYAVAIGSLFISFLPMLPITKAGWPEPSIVVLSVIAIILALTLPILPWTAAFFEFKRPTLAHLGLIFAIVISYLIVTVLVKRPLMRFLNKDEKR